MLTEEIHAEGVASSKIAEHEEAAHEKRNWVRLTYDCNNRCTFCLDSDTHDGEIRDREEVKQQILEGRRKGADRLILSGGEPTIHPNYVDFIKLGTRAGYPKIQTVTNGRLFSYPEFLAKCLDAGLSEITFSVHGPNARIHDALVGVKGAFEQEVAGLKAALADGRPIVNIDVVINRANVKHLPRMLEMFYEMGVREFDLLQVIPFGRAFTEGREDLFYDLEAHQSYIAEALAWSKKPDVHVWMNRFPPQHLEGYEQLIQDPYKLNDEVRGRKEEYARLLDEGIKLDCREPHRCHYCYLERLCDTLDGVRAVLAEQSFARVRVDPNWEAQMPPVFGGDPASSRRARNGGAREDGKVGLPMYEGSASKAAPTLEALVEAASPERVWVRAPDLNAAVQAAARFVGVADLELELDGYEGLAEALGAGDRIGGKRLAAVRVQNAAEAERVSRIDGGFEIVVSLTRDTAPWLLAPGRDTARLVVMQPTYERLTEASERDVDLRAFFAALTAPVAVEGIPACVTGRAPRVPLVTLDTAMMTPEGRLEIFRYTRRYILEHYRTRSLRCKTCVHAPTCDGMHINYVRAHGYELMQPVIEGAQRDNRATEFAAAK